MCGQTGVLPAAGLQPLGKDGGPAAAPVSRGCRNHVRGLKQQKVILSQLWRPEVQHQGVVWVGSTGGIWGRNHPRPSQLLVGPDTLGASRLVASSLQSLPCPLAGLSVALHILVCLLQDTLTGLRAHLTQGARILIFNYFHLHRRPGLVPSAFSLGRGVACTDLQARTLGECRTPLPPSLEAEHAVPFKIKAASSSPGRTCSTGVRV